MIKYEKISYTSNDKVIEYILATFDDSEMTIAIPMDESNSDYQAYLNKDKPQVKHLTEKVPVDEANEL